MGKILSKAQLVLGLKKEIMLKLFVSGVYIHAKGNRCIIYALARLSACGLETVGDTCFCTFGVGDGACLCRQ